MEKADSTVVEDYGSYVLERQQGPAEEALARTVIEKATARVLEHLPHNELERSYVAVGSLLIRVLEEYGVWPVGVTGSVRYAFDGSTGLSTRFTWAIDEQDFPGAFVGHAWLA